VRAEQCACHKAAAAALTYLRLVLCCTASRFCAGILSSWHVVYGHVVRPMATLLTNAYAPAAVAEETGASHAEADQDGDVEEL
jgi:hypothetical protein